MGYQIIKQPDEQFAIFCSYTDTIIIWDATSEEVMGWFLEREAARVRRDVGRLLEHVAADKPRKAYYQFAMTWEEALEEDREHGGEAWKEKRAG